MLKSIRIKNLKHLTIVYNIHKQPKIPNVNTNVPKVNSNVPKKNKSKQIICCNDEHIQRLIRNGGL